MPYSICLSKKLFSVSFTVISNMVLWSVCGSGSHNFVRLTLYLVTYTSVAGTITISFLEDRLNIDDNSSWLYPICQSEFKNWSSWMWNDEGSYFTSSVLMLSVPGTFYFCNNLNPLIIYKMWFHNIFVFLWQHTVAPLIIIWPEVMVITQSLLNGVKMWIIYSLFIQTLWLFYS